MNNMATYIRVLFLAMQGQFLLDEAVSEHKFLILAYFGIALAAERLQVIQHACIILILLRNYSYLALLQHLV
jgi:hypothetical protein